LLKVYDAGTGAVEDAATRLFVCVYPGAYDGLVE
jgi:hypothetical protein